MLTFFVGLLLTSNRIIYCFTVNTENLKYTVLCVEFIYWVRQRYIIFVRVHTTHNTSLRPTTRTWAVRVTATPLAKGLETTRGHGLDLSSRYRGLPSSFRSPTLLPLKPRETPTVRTHGGWPPRRTEEWEPKSC